MSVINSKKNSNYNITIYIKETENFQWTQTFLYCQLNTRLKQTKNNLTKECMKIEKLK